jgi:hypothetical protein
MQSIKQNIRRGKKDSQQPLQNMFNRLQNILQIENVLQSQKQNIFPLL